jgi:hypothetical protein
MGTSEFSIVSANTHFALRQTATFSQRQSTREEFFVLAKISLKEPPSHPRVTKRHSESKFYAPHHPMRFWLSDRLGLHESWSYLCCDIKNRLNAELGHGYQNLAGKIGLTRALNGAPVPSARTWISVGLLGTPWRVNSTNFQVWADGLRASTSMVHVQSEISRGVL